MDPPPAPKPWRGLTWTNESWRTAVISTDDSSSQESVADWHGGVCAVHGDGNSVGTGDRVGRGTGDGSNAFSRAVNGGSPGVIGGAVGSGGAVGAGGGVRGGGTVAVGADDCAGEGKGEVPRDNGRINGDGSYFGRADANVLNAVPVDVTGRGASGDAGRVDSNNNGGGVGRDLPPLAPVPKARAFPQRRRVHGDRRVEVRTVPFAAADSPSAPDADSSSEKKPSASPRAVEVPETKEYVVVLPEGPRGDGDQCAGKAGDSGAVALAAPQKEFTVAGASGAAVGKSELAGGGSNNSGSAGGDVAGAVGTVLGEKKCHVDVEDGGVLSVEKSIAKADDEVEKEAKRERKEDVKDGTTGIDETRVGHLAVDRRCGATAAVSGPMAGEARGEAEVVGPGTSFAPPVATNPTRAAVRQWRHMFLP